MLAQLPTQKCNITGNCTSLRLMSSPSLATALRCCMCEGGTKAGAAGVNDGTNVGKVLPKPPLGTKAGAEGTNSFAATLRKGEREQEQEQEREHRKRGLRGQNQGC
jgi:hypothetical protein